MLEAHIGECSLNQVEPATSGRNVGFTYKSMSPEPSQESGPAARPTGALKDAKELGETWGT